MANPTLILKTILLLSFIFAGSAFAASCAADAYSKTCSSCQFDNATGKFDKDCSNAQKAAGVACVSSSYPFMSIEYAQGKCPQLDECSSQLQQCLGQVGTGNEKADCLEGSAATCYVISDQCAKTASGKCPPPQPGSCGAPAALIMLIIGSVFLAGFIKKQ